MDNHGRNTVWGFRERVCKNLMFLNFARNMGADVHVVTELITSLLGLIVFPYEEIKKAGYNTFDKYKLNSLPSEWPSWTFDIGSSETLLTLYVICGMQSPTEGFFSLQIAGISEVWRSDFGIARTPKDPMIGEQTINAAELQRFVLLFADFLKEWERDYS